ncbi:MAG TPA: bis-aminopropyl spermidine synthase family protein [Pyrinomonadaceae bacterium]|nr:bis-aminopropyl spermidine synthase family protein [Pyrinomonadaceae bacterium]
MAEPKEIDLRLAINAISDVVQNRPRPLREFDQIYMKTGDMVLQSELVARWADGKRLAFVGDGDAISICVAYLHKRGIIDYGPSEIVVYDFDERICSAVTRFADREQLGTLRSELYNCLDAFPGPTNFDCFYTNPPWGASNEGESVKVFVQRGMEATGYSGEGMVVIADDLELQWPKQVLANVQTYAVSSGFYIQKMMPRLHSYHLDDAPNLRSCNLIFKSLSSTERTVKSSAISDPGRLANFYGRENPPRVKYVRERKRLDYGKAHEDEYAFDLLEAT